jgi:hypothetical protein
MRRLTLTALAALAATLGAVAATLALTVTPALAAGAAPVVQLEGLGWAGSFEGHVEAIVNPGEQSTECHIQYGIASVSEHEASCEQGTLEGGEQGVGGTLKGLHAASKYHYRFVLKNVSGEGLGNGLEEFETAPVEAPLVLVQGLGAIKQNQAHLEAIVNPDNQSTECFVDYGVASVSEHQARCEQEKLEGPFGEVGVSATVTGLTPAMSYQYAFVLKNVSGEESPAFPPEPFTTLAVPSEVQTGEPEPGSVTASSAEVGGKLNAGGEASYYIEYGPAPCAGTSCGKPTEERGSGAVTQEEIGAFLLEGLKPDTTYHYWLVAKNEALTVHGQALEFKTPLAAPTELETGAAEAATTTSATLGGEVNPGGEATYYFEYGTEACGAAGCGTKTATATVTGTSEEPVAPLPLSGLQPNTSYHYWLVVENAVAGPSHGEAGVFRTERTPGEVQAEAAAKAKPGEELAAALASQGQLEAQAASQAAATAAATAAASKRYEENNAANTRTKNAEEAVQHAEEKTGSKGTGTKTKKCAKGKKLKGTKCVKQKQKSKAKRGRKQ